MVSDMVVAMSVVVSRSPSSDASISTCESMVREFCLGDT